MQHMLNAMRMQAERQAAQRATTRLGSVSSYDPNNYSVKVRIQPEDTETGWIPVLSPWIGNGWGLFAPPTIGDMVEVQFQEGDFNAGMACLRFFNDSDRPLNVPSGEFWLVHASGSKLKFHNDGTVELVSTGTLTSSAPQWNHTGPVTINGNVQVNANIVASGDISDHTNKSMAGMRTVYNGHTHTDPQGGSVSTPSTGM